MSFQQGGGGVDEEELGRMVEVWRGELLHQMYTRPLLPITIVLLRRKRK